jgi:hypothetical protein
MPAEIKPDLHSEDRLDHLKESIYFEWLFLELRYPAFVPVQALPQAIPNAPCLCWKIKLCDF